MLPESLRDRVVKDHASGLSLRQIATLLTEQGEPTARGGKWHASTVRHVLRSVAIDARLSEARRTRRHEVSDGQE